MADNVSWLLERLPAGTKAIVWAHDGHVSFAHDARHWMGMHLRREFGDDYLAVGLYFDHGDYQGYDGQAQRLVRRHADPSPPDRLGAALASVSSPRYLVDLRRADGLAAEWLKTPLPLREDGSDGDERPVALAASYDLLLFVDETTSVEPTRAAIERLGPPIVAPGP
jgi:erythromycin esterase